MKKRYIFLLLAICSTQVLIAQNSFGIKAGANISTQKKERRPEEYYPYYGPVNIHSLVGIQLGAYYNLALIKRLSLATEINYSMIGAEAPVVFTTLDGREVEVQFDDRVEYIDLPVLLQYGFKKIQLAAGPSIAYKVNSRVATNNPDGLRYSPGARTSYSKLDFGLNAAVGYTVYKKISLGARYYYGLVDVDATKFWETKNRYFNISARYALK